MTDDEASRGPAWGNSFGLVEALVGFFAGEIAGSLLAAIADHLAGHTTTIGEDIGGLVGLWLGLVGAVLVASFTHRRSGEQLRTLGRLRRDYGLALRPTDVPLGIAVGLASSFLLVPLLTLPLAPFVPHLSQRLQGPAHHLTNHVSGAGYLLLALLICVCTPVVEELFFRGLVLRAMLGRVGNSGWSQVVSLVLSGIVFGLAHFQAVELLALSGFGVVLGVLAVRTGRLGAGMFAHATFNAITVIALARTH